MLNEKLQSPNIYGKDWTVRYRPWELIFNKEFSPKSEAMVYERWLKNRSWKRFYKNTAPRPW